MVPARNPAERLTLSSRAADAISRRAASHTSALPRRPRLTDPVADTLKSGVPSTSTGAPTLSPSGRTVYFPSTMSLATSSPEITVKLPTGTLRATYHLDP